MNQINTNELFTLLHLKQDSHYAEDVSLLLNSAQSIAKPFYTYLEIDSAIISNEYVKSILNNSDKAYVYIASCGVELEKFLNQQTDYFTNYVADAICNLFLKSMMDSLFTDISQKHQNIFFLHPGTIEQYPIEDLRQLFLILENVVKEKEIVLSQHYIIKPFYTICGIIFNYNTPCFDCRMCYNKDCKKRKLNYLSA